MSEVNVTIFDRNYRLAVTTGEEKMLEDCARQVNEQMLAVRAAGRVIAIDQIAVLTALELAYDAKKREHDAKKTAAAPPQTPPQPVQQQTPAAAVPTGRRQRGSDPDVHAGGRRGADRAADRGPGWQLPTGRGHGPFGG